MSIQPSHLERATMHVLTPTYKPVGGVVKVFDYVLHARHHGYAVSVRAPVLPEPSDALFNIERFSSLLAEPDVDFHTSERLVIREHDLVFISLPPDFHIAYNSLPAGSSPERIIHIVQNVRHVNPTWLRGFPLRLLGRPMARISTNEIVANCIRPYLDDRALHSVINLGHELGYFELDREDSSLHQPIRVASTTWKSDIGRRVEQAVEPGRFEFRFISDAATWAELRDLYHWADVFLCAPYAEEGFYMPGMEAMEAGCIVVTPDAGGNMAYCRPDENCLLVGLDDVPDYVAALERIATFDANEVTAFRRAGASTTADFTLDGEREAFGTFLVELRERLNF